MSNLIIDEFCCKNAMELFLKKRMKQEFPQTIFALMQNKRKMVTAKGVLLHVLIFHPLVGRSASWVKCR